MILNKLFLMIFLSGPALVLYLIIALGGILFLVVRLLKKAGSVIRGDNPKDSWLQDELDSFKKKK
jgi:hypothetical protein